MSMKYEPSRVRPATFAEAAAYVVEHGHALYQAALDYWTHPVPAQLDPDGQTIRLTLHPVGGDVLKRKATNSGDGGQLICLRVPR